MDIKELRLKRFIECRLQSKVISQECLKQQQRRNEDFKSHVYNQLLSLYNTNSSNILMHLNDELNRIEVGKSYQDGNKFELEFKSKVLELRRKLLLDIQFETKRFQIAYKELKRNELDLEKEKELKFALKMGIKRMEELRSKYVVMKHLNSKSSRIGPVETEILVNTCTDYGNTCHHRDIQGTAVKIIAHHPKPNPVLDAFKEDWKSKQIKSRKELQGLRNEEAAEKRYRTAITKVLMEHQKNAILEELMDIEIGDLKRKQNNAILHANTFSTFLNLNKRFEKLRV